MRLAFQHSIPFSISYIVCVIYIQGFKLADGSVLSLQHVPGIRGHTHTLALTGCPCIIIALSVVIKKNTLSHQQQTWLFWSLDFSALNVGVVKHQDYKAPVNVAQQEI